MLKAVSRYAYEQQVVITEHEYKIIVYKLDGVIYQSYLTSDGESEFIDHIDGTKASTDFLAHLSFNRYVLDTPLYREVSRLRDGYNVYLYLDSEMVDIDHVCCMAHARDKFKYAAESGDTDAVFFLGKIGELYDLEKSYADAGLSVDDITIARNNLRTKSIVVELRSKLDAMFSDGHLPRGELMEKALNYFKTFWMQLFNYQKDGAYSIDNNSAERAIRTLANERKNSLFFGSNRMAGASAVHHTIVTTCRLNGISVLEYLRKFSGKWFMATRTTSS